MRSLLGTLLVISVVPSLSWRRHQRAVSTGVTGITVMEPLSRNNRTTSRAPALVQLKERDVANMSLSGRHGLVANKSMNHYMIKWKRAHQVDVTRYNFPKFGMVLDGMFELDDYESQVVVADIDKPDVPPKSKWAKPARTVSTAGYLEARVSDGVSDTVKIGQIRWTFSDNDYALHVLDRIDIEQGYRGKGIGRKFIEAWLRIQTVAGLSLKRVAVRVAPDDRKYLAATARCYFKAFAALGFNKMTIWDSKPGGINMPRPFQSDDEITKFCEAATVGYYQFEKERVVAQGKPCCTML